MVEAIDRLESVTKRIQSILLMQEHTTEKTVQVLDDTTRIKTVTAILEQIEAFITANRNKTSSVTSVSADASLSTPNLILLLDEAVGDLPEKLYNLSEEIGDGIELFGRLTKKCFVAHRWLLWKACGMKKPSVPEFGELTKRYSATMMEFSEFQKNEGNKIKFKDHLSALEGVIFAFGWVGVDNNPAPFIYECRCQAMYFLNRIRTSYKGKDERHVEWSNVVEQLLSALITYAKDNHSSGLVWNAFPGTEPHEPFEMVYAPDTVTTSCSSNVPPPPPPPPQSGNFVPLSSSDKTRALLQDLNVGLDVTKRLKKVTPEMLTKNWRPEEKDHSIYLTKPLCSEYEVTAPSLLKKTNPGKPMREFNGKMHSLCNLNGEQDLVIEILDKKHCVYIYQCSDCNIKIKGKANSIALDSCRQTTVVFDGVVSQCEIVNSKNVHVQPMGEMPMISIQKSAECQAFLSGISLDAQVVTAQATLTNIFAQFRDGEDYKELTIPELLVSEVKDGRLVTDIKEM